MRRTIDYDVPGITDNGSPAHLSPAQLTSPHLTSPGFSVTITTTMATSFYVIAPYLLQLQEPPIAYTSELDGPRHSQHNSNPHAPLFFLHDISVLNQPNHQNKRCEYINSNNERDTHTTPPFFSMGDRAFRALLDVRKHPQPDLWASTLRLAENYTGYSRGSRRGGEGSGRGVGGEWEGSGRGVGGEWEGRSGRGVGGEWEGSGRGVGGEWEGSGRGVGGFIQKQWKDYAPHKKQS